MNDVSGIVYDKAKIKNFTDLDAWKEAHKLVLTVYNITKLFPSEEMFGLVSQMRRSAVSITSNIAEGFSRQSYKEKLQFYSIALGSTTELQNQLFTSRDIGYLSQVDFQRTLDQSIITHKITNGLIKSCKGFINHNS